MNASAVLFEDFKTSYEQSVATTFTLSEYFALCRDDSMAYALAAERILSGIVRREMTIDQAGDLMIDSIARTANGRFTAAEALGHREFVMTKLYRSA